MSEQHLTPLASLLLPLALLAACGSEGGPGELTPERAELERYFGLSDLTCFEYTSSDAMKTSPDLGVAMSRLGAEAGEREGAWQLSYRNGSGPLMEEVLSFEGDKLVLVERTHFGAAGYLFRMTAKDTALQLAGRYAQAGGSLSSSATYHTAERDLVARPNGDVLTGDLELKLSVALSATPLTLPGGASVSGLRHLYSEESARGARIESRTLVPGGEATGTAGWVRMELKSTPANDSSSVTYLLQQARPLEASALSTCGASSAL